MDQSYAIPCPPFSLQLSPWDRRFLPVYSKRVFCFNIPNINSESKETIAQHLLTAFQSTITQLPFLAGSVVPFPKGPPWLRDFRAEGAAYLEIRDFSKEINFQDLRKARFSSSLLDADKLCPLPGFIYVRDGPIDVCRMRANFVDGGLLLVLQVIHNVCDGHGISDILEIFAEKLRKAQNAETNGHVEAPKRTYLFDRKSVLSGNGLEGDIENHPAWTSAHLTISIDSSTITTSSNFHISSDSLQILKKAATPLPPSSSSGQPSHSSDQTLRISTHDAITALIWGGIMRARLRAGVLTEGATVHFVQMVDCRSRLQLPEPYFGNAIYGVKVSLAISDLAANPGSPNSSPNAALQAAARAIRAETNGTTADKFRDLLAYVERTCMEKHTTLSVADDLSTGSMIQLSYFGFRMHELDFGEALGGKIEAFRLPSGGIAPGAPVILPRLPDGSCEIMICEQDEVVRNFAEDELVQQFASRQC